MVIDADRKIRPWGGWRGIIEFDRKMRGFITEDALLIGVETRTSSPVRIVRDPEGQSVNVAGSTPAAKGRAMPAGLSVPLWMG